MKAIILARVSSKDQEEGQSIPSQERRLREYANRKNLQVDQDQVYKITESSTKETRKQFDQILAYIKKSDQPLALITDTVDRLQRSFRETPLLDELRKQGKLELHFLREGLIVDKNSNSAQLLQWDIGVLFASSYVRQLSDNVKRSKEQSIKNGEWVSKAPFGYKNVSLPSGKKTIEVDEYRAVYIVKMFELYATGNHSFQTIAQETNRWGIKNARGNPFMPSTIEFILKNPFYYGTMLVKGELHQHIYTPLIQEGLFNRVQETMVRHGKAPAHYAGKPLLFRGLVTCVSCGCMVTGYVKKGKYTYYTCSNAKGTCVKRLIKEEAMLEVVLDSLGKIQLSDGKINEIIAHLKQSFAHEQEFFKTSQEMLRRESDQLQDRISRLVDMHLDGSIDADIYKLKLEEYKKRQREIAVEIGKHVDADEATIITAQTVLDLAKRAKELFMSSNIDEKRQLMRFVFSNFTVDDGNLLLELKEPLATLTKMSDQPGWLGREDSNLCNWIQNPGSCH